MSRCEGPPRVLRRGTEKAEGHRRPLGPEDLESEVREGDTGVPVEEKRNTEEEKTENRPVDSNLNPGLTSQVLLW